MELTESTTAASNDLGPKGLLKAAIRDDDPVIYREHKFLYRRVKEVLPAEDEPGSKKK